MSLDDPAKRREERRMQARRDASAMTDERRRKLIEEDQRDKPLMGGFDAVSLPIEADPGPAAFVESERNDWLFPIGSGKTAAAGVLPQQLNVGGWVYLRCDNRLAARARFTGAAWQADRTEHIPSGDIFKSRGPGYVLNVDPSSWEYVDIPIGDREMGNGYRYYDVDEHDGTVTFRTVSGE